MSNDATADTATKKPPCREIQMEISPARQHQPSTETSTAGEKELAQPSRSVASNCSRKACRSKAKLRGMLLRTGNLRGHQSRNTTHRNSTCSEQATAINSPTSVAEKNLEASSRSTRRHKAKMVTPTYTVVWLQRAIMLDSRAYNCAYSSTVSRNVRNSSWASTWNLLASYL